MTRTAFLEKLRDVLLSAGYAWTADKAKLDRFMDRTEQTIAGSLNIVNIDSASFVFAWKAIGGKGKPTYKALRALPA